VASYLFYANGLGPFSDDLYVPPFADAS